MNQCFINMNDMHINNGDALWYIYNNIWFYFLKNKANFFRIVKKIGKYFSVVNSYLFLYFINIRFWISN